ILFAIEQGDASAAEQLLPLVYDELRELAAAKLAQEKPGQLLQVTALVHEAYLRLVASPGRESGESEPHWNSRGHFFSAAAEAMRRILMQNARGERQRALSSSRASLWVGDCDGSPDRFPGSIPGALPGVPLPARPAPDRPAAAGEARPLRRRPGDAAESPRRP